MHIFSISIIIFYAYFSQICIAWLEARVPLDDCSTEFQDDGGNLKFSNKILAENEFSDGIYFNRQTEMPFSCTFSPDFTFSFSVDMNELALKSDDDGPPGLVQSKLLKYFCRIDLTLVSF